MPLFSKKNKNSQPKKKFGTISNISKLRSPYFGKPLIPFRAAKKEQKKRSLLIPPARLKAPSSHKHNFIWIISGLFLSCLIIYGIFFSHFFDVKSWETIEDGVRLEKEDPVNQILAAEKGKNLFFIDEGKLNQKIKAVLPDVEKISVKKVFPQKIRVELKKYSVIANIINTSGNTKKNLLINSIGQIVDQNNENPELPYIKITTQEPLVLKGSALTKEKLEYIIGAYKLFEEKFGMKLLDSEYLPRERELHLRTERDFKIWIDMEKSFESQLEKLKKTASRTDIFDIYHMPLKYIDLRISGIDNEKVIFCRSDNPLCSSRNY